MKLTIYRIFYLISLSSLLGATIYSLVMTIISSLSYENKEECIIFSLCLVVLSIFILLQLYDIIRSFFKGGQFIHYLLFDNKQFDINKKFLVAINIILLLSILIFVYSLIIYFVNLGLIFNNAFIGVKFLLINFSILVIINVVFIDFYLLVYKQDKIIRKV